MRLRRKPTLALLSMLPPALLLAWLYRWMKPIMVDQVLGRGYLVHVTDIDIAYFVSGTLAVTQT
jgi:hypothetical protein